MKKFLLSATLLLLTAFSLFAQNEEEHSAEYKWGEKNALYVILGVIVLIVLIIWGIRRKKKSV
jgi:LPXTG-motif cell wall-anchored protein